MFKDFLNITLPLSGASQWCAFFVQRLFGWCLFKGDIHRLDKPESQGSPGKTRKWIGSPAQFTTYYWKYKPGNLEKNPSKNHHFQIFRWYRSIMNPVEPEKMNPCRFPPLSVGFGVFWASEMGQLTRSNRIVIQGCIPNSLLKVSNHATPSLEFPKGCFLAESSIFLFLCFVLDAKINIYII